MIDVKLIRIFSGEEIVAEVLSETEDTITVQNGLVVVPTNSGIDSLLGQQLNKINQRLPLGKSILFILLKSKMMSMVNIMKCLVAN